MVREDLFSRPRAWLSICLFEKWLGLVLVLVLARRDGPALMFRGRKQESGNGEFGGSAGDNSLWERPPCVCRLRWGQKSVYVYTVG